MSNKNRYDILNTIHGSKLYGLENPSSDTDYQCIFVPSYEEIILGNFKESKDELIHSKNEDLDIKSHSLKKFIKLCSFGDSLSLDLLFTPEKFILKSSPEWEFIKSHKEKLLISSPSAVDFAVSQAKKYITKGDRIKALKDVLDLLLSNPNKKLFEIKNSLSLLCDGELIKFNKITNNYNEEESFLYVCGKNLQFTAKCSYLSKSINKMLDSYGERSNLAYKMKGSDWKSLSHALRVCYQIEELFNYKHITFPLPQKDFLLKIKEGKVRREEVNNLIDEKLDIIKNLKTDLPREIDKDFWKDFLFNVYSRK